MGQNDKINNLRQKAKQGKPLAGGIGKPPAPVPFVYLCKCPINLDDLLKKRCPNCKHLHQIAMATKRRENRVVPQNQSDSGRLPVGSMFSDLVWDGTNWTGSLLVGESRYEASATGVVPLLHKLDQLYRASLRE